MYDGLFTQIASISITQSATYKSARELLVLITLMDQASSEGSGESICYPYTI